MNKNKDILLDILEKNWEPEQIYNMFPNPSPWKNEIEQEKTGYCWLITELHALMYFMSKKYGTKDIYFSLTDLIVFDKVEKANCFFEKVYKTRRLPTTNEEVTYILTNAMSDRGHWEMSVNLIKKYGLVPIEKKECEKNNLRTGEINAVLAFLMRYYASIIRDREKVKKINDFLQIKEIAMKKIKEILYTYIKKPKEKIQIPAYIKKKEKSWISPKEFYDRYVCFPFDDYACFFVGANEQDSVIKVSLKSLGNIYENGSLTFWKISSDVMYNGIYKQLQQGDTCWIGLDGGKFLFRDSGIYDDSVFNINEILGYDVQLNSEMISLYRMAKTTHSMLLFDMASGECGKWWRAQNNIENYETHNENFFISDSWLKKYVFIAVLNKKNINMDVFKHVFLEPWKIL